MASALVIDRTASAMLGRAAAAIGRDGFYRELLAAVGCCLPHDLSSVMRYSTSSRPDLLFSADYDPRFMSGYVQSFHRHDPFRRYWQQTARSGVISLRDVSVTEADRRRYVGAILHDVQVTDELGLFLPPVGRSSIALILDRRGGSYAAVDLARARLVYDLAAGLHTAHVAAAFGQILHNGQPVGTALAGSTPTRILDRDGNEIVCNAGWSAFAHRDASVFAVASEHVDPAGSVRIGRDVILHRTTLPETFDIAPCGSVQTIEPLGSMSCVAKTLAVPDGISRLLSRRENDVIRLMLRGYPIRTIAQRLGLAQGTVKNHRRRIYDKLNVTTEREVLLHCMADGSS